MGEALKDFSKQITDIYRSADFTPAERRQIIDGLQREMNDLLRRFMDRMEQSAQ